MMISPDHVTCDETIRDAARTFLAGQFGLLFYHVCFTHLPHCWRAENLLRQFLNARAYSPPLSMLISAISNLL